MNSLRLESVSKVFGSHQALISIDLMLEAGQRTALLGPSGAGKTTILRIIAGLEMPTTGQVYFDERDAADLTPVERNVAMVFQDYAVYPQLSVTENLSASLSRCGLPSKETASRIAETLDWFRLTPYAQRRPAQLSGGQLQRLALAKAVVKHPDLLLLDEPFSQLDMHLREQLRELLLDLHERFPSTLLIVTHDPIDAMRIASKIAIVDTGRIVATGACDEVYRRPVSRIAANLISPFGVNWMRFRLSNSAATVDSTCVTKELLLGKENSQQPPSPIGWSLSQSHVDNLFNQFGSVSSGKVVWLGFRPEAVQLVSSDAHNHTSHALRLQGTVKSTQSLGFAKLATITSDRLQFKSLVNGVSTSPTSAVTCEIHEDDLMWFAVLPDE